MSRGPTTWLIAAGSFGRDYTDQFLRYGMAFVGGAQKIEKMLQVQTGDRMVLKQGLSKVIAVGEVLVRDGKAIGCGDKLWLRDFDGWDLQAYCYVDWHIPPRPQKTSGLRRGTIHRVRKPDILRLADRWIRKIPPKKQYDPEPADTRRIEDEEILEFLIREGLRPALAEDLASAFRRIRLLARYYYNECEWEDVREHETRTFLIVPLLLGLGWAEQQLKIELPTSNRQRLDIACFRRSYQRGENAMANNEDCVLIIETKDFKTGLHYASNQARQYAKQFSNCRAIIVSNGYCYKAYIRTKAGMFDSEPSSYLNLLNPQDRYPLNPETVAGALDVLKVLLPHSWR